jgi:hypothetical protein
MAREGSEEEELEMGEQEASNSSECSQKRKVSLSQAETLREQTDFSPGCSDDTRCPLCSGSWTIELCLHRMSL